jgi:ubiquinone/menaquinone biosynthesis C-methylase UbiE
MPNRPDIQEINKQQKAYYESRFVAAGGNERAANVLTNLWTRLRRRIQHNDERVGVRRAILADHQRWLGDLSEKRVLDLGCFAGNALTIWIAERCREYVGLDLSEHAIAQLQTKLNATKPGGGARAYAGDFLQNQFPDEHFDVIYAHSVLHHFQDIRLVLDEMNRILKPGGVVVSVDPLATEPLNQLARAAYRPFQSDRAWEWPFTRRTFQQLHGYFVLDRVQGYRGLSMLSFPLALLPFMGSAAQRLGRLGARLERRWATAPGPGLWVCWLVAMRLVKPGASTSVDGGSAMA